MQEQLEVHLERFFHYKDFRPGQKEIIEAVLQGKDVLGILPTGSGKSICYQLPSLLLPNITIVISPLISLMIDQVRETKAFHIKEVAALHSMQSFEERQAILRRIDHFKIIYISPELIQNKSIIQRLGQRKISLFVIDEAHCISQWGYDFRPDYLRLKHVIEDLNNPPLLALSGTITKQIENDILKELDRPQMTVFHHRTDRENITLVVDEVDDASKDEKLIAWLAQYKVPTIIYFSSRDQTERTTLLLMKEFPERKLAYYHGGLDQESRLHIQQQFLYDQLDIICATSAFGMGINKANVRLVIHYHMPAQKESFIQEIGRAGRDGRQSVSVLLYSQGDEIIPTYLIENELPSEKEVRYFLNYLFILKKQGRTLPDQEDMLAELNIDEVKYRLLMYQVEKRHLIKGKKIVYHEENWQVAFNEIVSYCEERRKTKRSNLQRMYDYTRTSTCLRKQLYEDFGQPVESLNQNCCSVCGYDANLIKSKEKEVQEGKKEAWKLRLADLFEIGEFIETSQRN